MAGKTRQEWVDYFAGDDICFTPVLNLKEMSQHPQVQEREMVIMLEDIDGTSKNMAITGCPIKLSDTPAVIQSVFSELGEHTENILEEAGYSSAEIMRLKKDMIIA
jgi:crotonobetainyl-CoA:carnitine CoA-transferase CaiB-like acyl-CoA transferase